MSDKVFVAKNGLIVNTNLIWANSGQVGINNASPDANLTVTGTANVQGNVTVTANLTVVNTIKIGNSTVNAVANATNYTGIANNTNFVGSVAAANVVSNTQLQSNLAAYQTLSGLASNVAILTANNANNLGGVAASKYVNTSGAYTITGVHTYNANVVANAVLTVGGNTNFANNSSNSFNNFNGSALKNYSEFCNTATNTGTAIDIPADSNYVRYTLNSSATLTLPSNQPATTPGVKNITVFIKQNATGGFTATFANGASDTLAFNNSSTQPGVNINPNKVTIFTCTKFDGDTNWYISLAYIDP